MDRWRTSLHWYGEKGDQDINWAQNATLASCGKNGIDVHLFEVMNRGEYIYCGRIELVDKPYTDIQPDEDGMDRKVWMFPIRPVPDNDVEKPNMFVFKDMDDYRRMLAGRKKSRNREIKKTVPVIPTTSNGLLIHVVEIPAEIVGQKVKHKLYGEGTISSIDGASIVVLFDSVGEKKLGYDICIKNRLIEMI